MEYLLLWCYAWWHTAQFPADWFLCCAVFAGWLWPGRCQQCSRGSEESHRAAAVPESNWAVVHHRNGSGAGWFNTEALLNRSTGRQSSPLLILVVSGSHRLFQTDVYVCIQYIHHWMFLCVYSAFISGDKVLCNMVQVTEWKNIGH